MNTNRGNPNKLILPEPSHVGYVTKDLERSMNVLGKTCGLGPFTTISPDYQNKRYRGQPEDFKMRLALVRIGDFLYELVEVIHGRTIYEDFMKDHGEGIHHLGYEISDLDRWIALYNEQGINPIMSGDRLGLKWAYFDTGEITIELLDRTPEGVIV